MINNKQYKKFIKEYLYLITEWRRHLHAHPERPFREYETAKYVANILSSIGYDIKRNVGGTGVIATLDTNREGSTIAFRVGMDGNNIMEKTGLSYESINIGVMHACGHDIHMAAALASAKYFSIYQDQYNGIIKFIFQPAVDSYGGSQLMLDDENFDYNLIDYIFGFSFLPELKTNQIAMKNGVLTSTLDTFKIKIMGSGGHSALPTNTTNTINIANLLISYISKIRDENIDLYETASLSFTSINSNTEDENYEVVTHNIVPEHVIITGSYRCETIKSKLIFKDRIEKIVASIASLYNIEIETSYIVGYPPLLNDEATTSKLIKNFDNNLGNELINLEKIVVYSEDFSLYLEKIKGSLIFIGINDDNIEENVFYSSNFNVSEETIETELKVFISIIDQFLN